jgi:hypothetical protein
MLLLVLLLLLLRLLHMIINRLQPCVRLHWHLLLPTGHRLLLLLVLVLLLLLVRLLLQEQRLWQPRRPQLLLPR